MVKKDTLLLFFPNDGVLCVIVFCVMRAMCVMSAMCVMCAMCVMSFLMS